LKVGSLSSSSCTAPALKAHRAGNNTIAEATTTIFRFLLIAFTFRDSLGVRFRRRKLPRLSVTLHLVFGVAPPDFPFICKLAGENLDAQT
jgi:hypothetical protein